MLKCNYQKYFLKFLQPAGTSRGILREKETWIISLFDDEKPGKIAYGECGIFRGLSYDDQPDFEEKLQHVCENIPEKKEAVLQDLKEWPSIHFGVEMLLADWENGASHTLFKSDFTENEKPIDINGLIWMGSKQFMLQQIKQKLDEGFSCLKIKIGAIDFETELEILGIIRRQFSASRIQIRVDANGAFSPEEALKKLQHLSRFDIHSIEQPIKAGQVAEMAMIAEKSPIPVALDEELIGKFNFDEKQKLLEIIRPAYIILKPTLLGGFVASEEWMALIEEQGGNWWITSALESNIGLNAIAQFVFTKKNSLPQGLGTGQLYSNNFDSPLTVRRGKLFLDQKKQWNFGNLNSNTPVIY
jgi:o-succinylbenzoate synthase